MITSISGRVRLQSTDRGFVSDIRAILHAGVARSPYGLANLVAGVIKLFASATAVSIAVTAHLIALGP